MYKNNHNTTQSTNVEMKRITNTFNITYLKFKLGAAKVGPLLLPEVVGLDDEGDVDARRERLLQDLQQRLDAVPLRTTHVHDNCEAMSGHLLAADRQIKRSGFRRGSTSTHRLGILLLNGC